MADISKLSAGPMCSTTQASGTQKPTTPEATTSALQAPILAETPKPNDFFESASQSHWVDNFPQAAEPNACMGEPVHIEVKPKTSAKLEELEKERAKLQSLAEANPLHPSNTKKLVDIGNARENVNEAISKLRPPEDGAWYENNFLIRANASLSRAVLGLANDTVLGLAQMVQENAHKMPIIPGADLYGTGVEAAQQINEYRIQQENLRLGNTTQEEISAQTKQQLSAMWDGFVEPMTTPWNRGDYLEAVARGTLEVGSLVVGVGEATAAVKGARAANIANKTAVATKAAEAANVVNKGVEAANVLNQTAKGVESAGALGKPVQVKPINPGEAGRAGAKASKYGDEVVDGTKRVDFTKKTDVDVPGGTKPKSVNGEKVVELSRLPNVDKATVDPRKVTEYALNPNHPVGANKAKVFQSSLGYNQSNANDLINQIQSQLPNNKAVLGNVDKYGQRYTVDIPITGPNGNTVTVRTGWILETGTGEPKMTTLFVK